MSEQVVERQLLGVAVHTEKDYNEPQPAPLFVPGELKCWSFYRARITEFMATFLFLYITILNVMGYSETLISLPLWVFKGLLKLLAV